MAATAQKEKQFENHLHAEEARWFAVYVKYKREKVVKKLLQQKGIEVYLPLQKVTRRYVRKIKHLELPLINCHLFVKIKQSEYVPVLETENVVNFLKLARNLISIPEKEIEVMKRVVGENLAVSIEPRELVKGDKVEITAGSLIGMQGILTDNQGSKNVIIELERSGFQMRLNVPLEYIERIK